MRQTGTLDGCMALTAAVFLLGTFSAFQSELQLGHFVLSPSSSFAATKNVLQVLQEQRENDVSSKMQLRCTSYGC